jgi:hypothetical protein
MANTRGQSGRRVASGKVNSYGDYIEAMNYFMNTLLGKTPPSKTTRRCSQVNPGREKRSRKGCP